MGKISNLVEADRLKSAETPRVYAGAIEVLSCRREPKLHVGIYTPLFASLNGRFWGNKRLCELRLQPCRQYLASEGVAGESQFLLLIPQTTVRPLPSSPTPQTPLLPSVLEAQPLLPQSVLPSHSWALAPSQAVLDF